MTWLALLTALSLSPADTPRDYACGVAEGWERDYGGVPAIEPSTDYLAGYAVGQDLHDPELAAAYRRRCTS